MFLHGSDEITIASAIAALERPSAMSSRTSRSRGVRPSSPPSLAACPHQFYDHLRSWSENRTLAGQAAAAGGAERRRLLWGGRLAGFGYREDVGVEAGVDGFEDDSVAAPFDGAGVAADLAADVRAVFVVVGAEEGLGAAGVDGGFAECAAEVGVAAAGGVLAFALPAGLFDLGGLAGA